MFVSFLSDFGLSDEFVGVVHGVIARVAPDVRVIDITHGVPPGNIRAGALVLVRAIQYLPDGVALAVVDPGVGGARDPVAVATEWGAFVGPDNGLLAPAVAITGGGRRAVRIDNPEVLIPSAGATFEGRDRFAPAAALLASKQAKLDDLGTAIDPGGLTPLMLPLPEVADDHVQGEVWWIDRFGNAQTNIGPDDLSRIGLGVGDEIEVTIGAASRTVPWVRTYEEAGTGRPAILVDSAGLLSFAVAGGRAVDELEARERMSVTLRRPGGTTPVPAPRRR